MFNATTVAKIALLDGKIKPEKDGEKHYLTWNRITVDNKRITLWKDAMPVMYQDHTADSSQNNTLTVVGMDGRIELILSDV